MPQASSKRVLLGRIATAHGIRGDVLVRSFAADPADIAAYGPLTDPAGARSFMLNVVRVTAKGVICRVAGVTDRNGAEALAGTDLYVDRDRLPPPADGEFYHVDLIGLAVVDPQGVPLGQVVSVQNFGSCDLLEIRLIDRAATELVALTDAFVPTIDVPGGRVVVRLPNLVDPESE